MCCASFGLRPSVWSDCAGVEPEYLLSSLPPISLQSKVMSETCGGCGRRPTQRQSTKPLPLSSEKHNRAKSLSIQPAVARVFWVQDAARALVVRPDVCLDCPVLINSAVTAVIHDVILLSSCHTAVSRLSAAKLDEGSFFSAVPQGTSRRAPTPAPGVVLWFWHRESS